MRRNSKRGFTLVELIVALVILAILASLLVPALTGYMDKTKKQAVISEARDVWTAAQAALTECYALYPESFNDSSNSCRFTITVNGVTYQNVGRITNGALNALQKRPNDKTEAGSSSRISSATRPSNYFNGKPKKTDVIIQIFHTQDGRVIAINFAKDGYMATVVPGQETTCEYDGACIASSG